MAAMAARHRRQVYRPTDRPTDRPGKQKELESNCRIVQLAS